MTLALWLVVAACGIAAYTDVSTRRVPNVLVAALAVLGVGLHAPEGVGAVLIAIAVLALVVLLGTWVHALGLVGGGDIKLFAAAAATISTSDIVPFLLYTTVAGGLVAVAYSLAHRRLGATLTNVREMAASMAIGASPNVSSATPGTMPYALAIFAGAALLASAHSFAPFLRISL